MNETGAPQNVVVLVNGNSRRGAEWYPLVLDGLKKRGVTVAHAETFTKAPEFTGRTRAFLREGRPWIIIGGGDGTFSSVAAAFAGSRSVLGVLPLGTGNAFARDLDIETDVDAACDVIAAGNIERVDLGYANDKPFVNVATIGLTELIAKNLDPTQKKLFGPLAYAFSLYRSLQAITPFEVEMTMDDVTERFRSLQVVVGNGRFHAGPFLMAPDADIASGQLIAYALKSTHKADFLRLGLALMRGKQTEMSEVVTLRGSTGRIATTPGERLILDGEESGTTPFTLALRPGALQVLAPPASERLADVDPADLA